jgi:hypothetical protein
MSSNFSSICGKSVALKKSMKETYFRFKIIRIKYSILNFYWTQDGINEESINN